MTALRYVSFAEVGRICRAVLREPMHLCTCVSEEVGIRKAEFFFSLLSQTASKNGPSKMQNRRLGDMPMSPRFEQREQASPARMQAFENNIIFF